MISKKENLQNKDRVFIIFPQQTPKTFQEWNRVFREFATAAKEKIKTGILPKARKIYQRFIVIPLKFLSQKTNLGLDIVLLIIIFSAIIFLLFFLHQKSKNTPKGAAKLFVKSIERKKAGRASKLFVKEIRNEMEAHFQNLFENSRSINYFKTSYNVLQKSSIEAEVGIVSDYQRKDKKGNVYRYLASSGFEEYYDRRTGKKQRLRISSGRLIEEYLGFSPSAFTYGMFSEIKLVKEEGKWLIKSVR